MAHHQQRRLQAIAERAAARKVDASRHKCFVSYHAEDANEIETFLEDFGSEFIARTVGVTEEDDFIDSDDTDYVMDTIRTKYLGDSTVTIVLIGKCTWARRFVDWEVYSSLRSSKHSTANGLLAVTLPSVANTSRQLPARVDDNVEQDSNDNAVGYARWMKYPTRTASLRSWIEDAFNARTSRSDKIDNTRGRRQHNSACT